MAEEKEIFAAVDVGVTKTANIFTEKLRQELQNIFSTDVSKALKAEFLKVYDTLASAEQQQFGGEVKNADPTSLTANRGLFARQLDKELARVIISDNEIVINVMNKDELGFGRGREANSGDSPEGAPSTVDWLGYYIEGMVGEFGFITPEHYAARGRRSTKPLGRFGKGFLIPRDRYVAELWEEVTGVAFGAIRHAISGQAPFGGFEEVPKKFDFSPFISKALAKAEKAAQALS